MDYSSEHLVTWDEVQEHCAALARDIVTDHPGFDRILAVTRAGLFPAGILARELDIRYVETIGIEGYDDTKKKQAKIIKECRESFRNNVLVVDDLVDTGETFQLLRQSIDGLFITIYAKPKGRPYTDLYRHDIDQHIWVRFPWDTRRQYARPVIRTQAGT